MGIDRVIVRFFSTTFFTHRETKTAKTLIFSRHGYRFVPNIFSALSIQYMYGDHIKQSMDQPGKVVNPARGQLNRVNELFPVPVRA